MTNETEKAIVFIDGTWLIHNGNRQDRTGSRFDYKRLIAKTIARLELELGRQVQTDSVHFFTSTLTNVHQSDLVCAQRWDQLLAEIEQMDGFTVHPFEQDMAFKKRKDMAGGGKVEKMVDVGMAVYMIQSLYLRDYSWAIIITGDIDFKPAISALRNGGKKILLVSAEGYCHNMYTRPPINMRTWHKMYWLDELIEMRSRHTPLPGSFGGKMAEALVSRNKR